MTRISLSAAVDICEAPVLSAPRTGRLPNRKCSVALAAAGAVLLAVVIIAGLLLQPAAQATDFAAKSLAPSLSHPFGTDWMGRDMLCRTLAGLSTSVLVGLGAALSSALIALVLAAAAALGPRWADAAVSWLVDLMMGIPHIVLLILISYALGKGFWGVTIGVALTHWPSLTRVLRAEILQCRNADYVIAAARLGQSRLAIAARHMLPYVLPQFVWGLCCCSRTPSCMRRPSPSSVSGCRPRCPPSASFSASPWGISPRGFGGSRCFPGRPSCSSSCCSMLWARVFASSSIPQAPRSRRGR